MGLKDKGGQNHLLLLWWDKPGSLKKVQYAELKPKTLQTRDSCFRKHILFGPSMTLHQK